MRTYNSFKFEMYKIKKQYCKKCIYFDKENFKCSKDKVYRDCFKKHEIVLRDKNIGGTNDLKWPKTIKFSI